MRQSACLVFNPIMVDYYAAFFNCSPSVGRASDSMFKIRVRVYYWENSCSFGLRYVSWYKYLIVSLVFSHLGFWSGNLFLIAPFPDLCLLVPFYDGPDLKLFILDGWGRSFLFVAWPTGVQLVFFFCSGVSKLFGAQGCPSSGSLLNLLSPRF